jgi:hypothetical protein
VFWVFLSWVWGDWRSALDIVKTCDGDRLASQGISSLLDLEDPAWPRGSANRFR